MASTAPSPNLRNLFEGRFALLREMETALQAELNAFLADETARSRREIAADLNAALRRLRQAEDVGQAASVLAEAAAGFCEAVAVLSVEGDLLRGCALGGNSAEEDRFRGLELPLSSAAAAAGAVETGDTRICLNRASELSASLQAFLPGGDDRVAVIPVLVNGQAAGLLCARGPIELSALELLAQAAGAALQGRPAARIARAMPGTWSELTPDEQQLHLRAQHFARVEVARLRVYAAGAVKAGHERRNLYAALRKEIDSARETFRGRFISAGSTMVDYYHLELLRNLANEDPALLGEDYPGPLS